MNNPLVALLPAGVSVPNVVLAFALFAVLVTVTVAVGVLATYAATYVTSKRTHAPAQPVVVTGAQR